MATSQGHDGKSFPRRAKHVPHLNEHVTDNPENGPAVRRIEAQRLLIDVDHLQYAWAKKFSRKVTQLDIIAPQDAQALQDLLRADLRANVNIPLGNSKLSSPLT